MPKQDYKKPKKDTWVRDTAGTNKKVDAFIKSQGGSEWDISGFKQYMDYRSARQEMYNKANQTATSNWNKSFEKDQQAEKARVEKERKEAEARANKRKADQKKRQQNLLPQIKKKPKDEPFLTDVKNFFTGKDIDGDGQRNGLLGAMDRYLMPISKGASEFVAPGNHEMMKQQEVEKYGKVTNPLTKAADINRGKETKILNTTGAMMAALAPYGKAYQGVDLAFNKVPKLANFALNNPYKALAVKGGIAGGLAETGLAGVNELVNPDANNMKDYAKRVALGVGGGAVGDPLLRAAGVGIRKGSEKYAANVMKDLLPKNEQVAKSVANTLKSDRTLPVKSNQPNPLLMNDLLPRKSDIASPNYLPELLPKVKNKNVTVPKIGPSFDEVLANPRPSIPEVPNKVGNTDEEILTLLRDESISSKPSTKVDTSEIDRAIEAVTRQLDQVKNQPKSKTKTEIDDAIRSLEINDGYLSSSRTKGKISNEEYHQKIQENELKREALLKESDAYTHKVPDELKHSWNNETKAYELGDYSTKKAYGGGYTVKKGTETVGKFRTEEEATRFMQQSVASEKGIDVNFEKDGVLNWKSTYDETGKKWDIQAGDYTIHRGGKDNWTVKKGDKVIGTFKNEKKAREVAQRHYDSQPKANEQATALEQQLNELNLKRESLVNPPKHNQNLVPKLNVNRTTQKPTQPLVLNLNRNTSETIVTPREQPVRTSEPPSNNLKERGHIETLRESENTTQGLKEQLKGMYEPTTNERAVRLANQEIEKGLESAVSFVKSAGKLNPEHIATAHRLIQEFQKAGDIGRAVDIAEYIAEKGTQAGQTVQAFSIFNRLSPEGILIHAKRVADKANAKLNVLQEKVVITNETAAQLTDLASTVEKMTQQKTVANDVISLMEKAKKGDKLSSEETKLIRQFVDDAKQWIDDIAPKKTKPKGPKKIISPAVKEQVVNFLDSQEEAARRRLEARKNRANSLPAEDFYDYAVIGASKLAKGTIKFADFSEQMVREFGEDIRPYIQQIYDKASEMVNNEVQRTVNRLSEVQKVTNKALKNGKLEEADAENLRKFALSINNMSGSAKIEASQELQAILQGLERPSLLQQISATQTIAQLLNPKTLGRNAVGNEMFYRLERLNKLVATPIDWTRVAIFGGKRSITFRTNNQGQYWKNWVRGWKAGLKGVNPEGLATQYDLRPNSFNGKWNPLKYLERTLGAALKSFDYAGYKRAVNNTIGELATLRAVNEGLTGQARKEAIARYIREADENVLAIADQYGKYATFQDNNMIAMGLQKFKRGLNFGKEFGIGDLVIKYPKTPGALLARALEYSPAGFLKSAYAISKPFFKKGFSTSEVIESFTRALIGTAGTTGIAWFLADKGILTGSGSKDFDVKELEKTAGKAEYSLNYDALKRWVFSGFDEKAAETQKGDNFISYNWAQPIAMSMAIGANASYNVNTSGNPSLGVAAWEATNGALDSLVGMSVLQGVQKAFTSYPGQTTGEKLMDIAGQMPASFIPTFSNQIRQKSDNTARNVYDPLKLNQFKNQAKNKVPGMASVLPPSFDTLGNKKEVYKDKSNTFFNVFLNPAFVSRYNPSPEAEMVLKVINDTGDESLAPRRAQKYLQIDGKRYDLTPQQYSDYQRILGTEVRTQLQDLQKEAGSYTSEELGAKISKILDAAGRKVRKELKGEYGG
ncbi:hypothetical protein V7182_23795 [Neobacillus drentensis]|uniref:hypothetical protein n=1 Tax=Neobacillus drentensis TaxID=220684 RepID=UPI0030002857